MTGFPWQAGDQLLANDLNAAISNAGAYVAAQPLAYIGPHSATVGIASGTLITAGTYKTALTIQTLPGSTGNVFLRADGSASVANTGMMIQAGGGARSFGAPGFPIPNGNITAITDAGTPQTVLISGG